MLTVAPTQDDIFTALRSFLMAVMPAGLPVVQGQLNRVAEVAASDYIVMVSPISMPRIATNTDTYQDAVFTGSIVGTLLTITAVNPLFTGTLRVGSPVFGVGVATGTAVTALGTGTGGIGTYTITPSQSTAGETLAAGVANVLEPTEIVIQVDVHGPNAQNNAQIISALFRDNYAVEQFASSGIDVTPLYVDDPKQVPFFNAEQQWENRWTIDCHMQSNATIQVPLQFADKFKVTAIDVDVAYPPTP